VTKDVERIPRIMKKLTDLWIANQFSRELNFFEFIETIKNEYSKKNDDFGSTMLYTSDDEYGLPIFIYDFTDLEDDKFEEFVDSLL
jgi:hypothetical protein